MAGRLRVQRGGGPDARLDADVAQLLAAVALSAGADRAVDTAIAVLGVEPVRSSLPVLQLNALSGATRTALQHHKGLLKELQHTVADRCQRRSAAVHDARPASTDGPSSRS